MSATYLGQTGTVDLVGADAGMGSDATQDIKISISGLPANVPTPKEIQSIKIIGPAGFAWEYGPNLGGNATAEFFRSVDGTTGSLYINPTIRSNQDANGVPLGSSTGSLVTLTNSAKLNLVVAYKYAAGLPDETLASPLTVTSLASPPLSMPAVVTPAKVIEPGVSTTGTTITITDLGQVTGTTSQRGYVQLRVSGLDTSRDLGQVNISDQAGFSWSSTGAGTPDEQKIAIDRTGRSSTADLYFQPVRNERVNVTGVDPARNMILRFTYVGDNESNGEPKQYVQHFAGGTWDPSAAFEPFGAAYPTSISNGTDLQTALGSTAGVINLSPGALINISQSLEINRSLKIVGNGATLRVDASGWTTANNGVFFTDNSLNLLVNRRVKISLENFKIEFTSASSWLTPSSSGGGTVDDGFAVINLSKADQAQHELSMLGMTVKSPANLLGSAPSSSHWVMNVQLVKSGARDRGAIVSNYFTGGSVALTGGPWTVTDNYHFGAISAYTYSPAAFAARASRDLVFKNNTAYQSLSTGRISRLINLPTSSYNALLESNSFTGGMDGTEGVNNPEIILTETNDIYYEGRTGAISADGRVLRLLKPSSAVDYRAYTVTNSDSFSSNLVVSILNEKNADGSPNPYAGKWYPVAQRIGISPPTYLMRDPLPQGDFAVSLVAAFQNDRVLNNTIDMGTNASTAIALAGGVFGSQVVGNTIIGGGQGSGSFTGTAIQVDSIESNKSPGDSSGTFPIPDRWSRLPSYDVIVTGNTIKNSPRGVVVYSAYAEDIRNTSGRRLVTANIFNNKFDYEQSWLTAWDSTFDGNMDSYILTNKSTDDSTPPTVTVGFGTDFGTNGKVRRPKLSESPITFDFGAPGSPGSPVAAGTIGVTNFTNYTSGTGTSYGWLPLPGGSTTFNGGAGTDFTRDGMLSSDMTFQVDLRDDWGWFNNGLYNVTVALGDMSASRTATVSLEGIAKPSISTLAGEIAYASYSERVTDGTLTVRIQGPGGSALASIVGLSIVPQGQFNNSKYASAIYADPTAINIQLSNNLAQVVNTDGTIGARAEPSGQVYSGYVNGAQVGMPVTAFEPPPPPPSAWPTSPSYEWPQRYMPFNLKNLSIAGTSSTYTPRPLDYDFGTGTSPVATNYTKVDNNSWYNATQGYGWTNLPGGSNVSDWGSGGGLTALTQDAVYSPDMTFQVDLPNGNYMVTPTVGQASGSGRMVDIFLQNRWAGFVNTPASTLAAVNYFTSVVDNKLVLRLAAYGNSTPMAYLSSLSIVPLDYDFGTTTSPTAPGTTPVSHTSTYNYSTNTDRGYGWTGTLTGMNSIDRGPISGVNDQSRDSVYAQDMTFQVDVPNGNYDIVLTFGDHYAAFATAAEVYFQGGGAPTASLTPAKGQVIARSFRVNVTTGSIKVRLKALTGTGRSGLAYLPGMSIVPI